MGAVVLEGGGRRWTKLVEVASTGEEGSSLPPPSSRPRPGGAGMGTGRKEERWTKGGKVKGGGQWDEVTRTGVT